MKCIYCKKEATGKEKTNEHVIPQWIIKELDIKHSKIGLVSLSKELELLDTRYPVVNTLTHKVCQKCNNGWLSKIDKSCSEMLKILMQGVIPEHLMTLSNINKLYTLIYKIFLNFFATSPESFLKHKMEAYNKFFNMKYPPNGVNLFLSKLRHDNKKIVVNHIDHWSMEFTNGNIGTEELNGIIGKEEPNGIRFKFYLQLGDVAFIICSSGVKNRKITYDPRILIPLKCDKNIVPKLINEISPCIHPVPDNYINHFLFSIIELVE